MKDAKRRLQDLLLFSLQAGVSLVVLLGMFLVPQPNGPVTLVPLNDAGEQAIPTILSPGDIKLLARGSMPNSYVVAGPLPDFVDLILEHGVLALNARAPGCGPVSLKGRRI
ncbi:hypothetical protein [Erythrobacter crassostreae]|uniref:Uncharacterized protein n=1 Tax=Erythrobacter crassostreae TaxID=2828328 RepID=A0A9X1JNW7_9SPHN|nr:hypothetical protein [Erythrobacter crassostrea]MBV7260123.1 hypothetical protein [Erythrobacter crassostrea]